MTCLEAQSNIMAFIDGKLSDDEVVDFVRHMQSCKNCSEELEIYYTLIIGMRRLDNNEDLPQNFKLLLEEDLDNAKNRIQKAKRFKISTFGVFFAAFVFVLFLFYGRILQKVHTIEQITIKERQGDFYFLNNFRDYISFDENDIIVYQKEKFTKKEETVYERIKSYNITHNYNPFEEEEENLIE
ncbi:MAG: zf-HC2 domain-containing protein [Lachnospiraceae bacterium]|nr:zf-HC2 domain-containing protein [Lachnospiraceae bacterium]MBQ9233236.1 zf-HC2 domain-containing protein [Lachnospiraceae bacterium]